MNFEATVFVYRHKDTAKFRAVYIADAIAFDANDDWEHIATIEPSLWIETHYNNINTAGSPTRSVSSTALNPLVRQLVDK